MLFLFQVHDFPFTRACVHGGNKYILLCTTMYSSQEHIVPHYARVCVHGGNMYFDVLSSWDDFEYMMSCLPMNMSVDEICTLMYYLVGIISSTLCPVYP